MGITKQGRPPVTTPDVVAKLAEAFKLDVTVEEACAYAGISKDTYYRKLKTEPEFSDEMERARLYASWQARRSVIREMEHDGHLALKYLERKRKAEFSPRSEIDIEGLTIPDLIRQVEEERRPVRWQDMGAQQAGRPKEPTERSVA